MMQWIQDSGAKAAAGLLTILTAAEGIDPTPVLGISAPSPHARVPKQQHGRVNFPGLLLWLVLVVGSVAITLSVAEHCLGGVRAAFAPLAEETPAP